jgi:hypothetical protein
MIHTASPIRVPVLFDRILISQGGFVNVKSSLGRFGPGIDHCTIFDVMDLGPSEPPSF